MLYYFLNFAVGKFEHNFFKKSHDVKNLSIKKLIEIKGMGPSTIKKLEEAGIYKIEDLNKITIDSLISIKGIGKDTAQKIYKNIKKIK